MDYFYVGTGAPAGGLNNAYFKVKYTTNVLTVGLDYHSFALNKAMVKTGSDGIKNTINNQLGTELDFTLNYNMNKFTNIELGYSIMNATDSMPIAKAQSATATYDKTGTWFYAMINIRPDFFYSKPVALR